MSFNLYQALKRVRQRLSTPESMDQLLAKARTHQMTDAEREAQRRSFAYGNVNLHNSAVTREMVAAADEKLKQGSS